MVPVDDTVSILQALTDARAAYEMELGDESYPLHDVRIYETATPVRGSAARGNVYSESRSSYRIEASVDPTAYGRLSHTMLGPSSRFGGLRISARTAAGHINIEGSLLSMSRTGGTVRLQMAVVCAG